MLPQEQVPQEPRKPVTIYCTSCWKDREITTNGKCKVCGTKFPRPAHWNITMKKLRLIADNDEFTPIEIKGALYFLGVDHITRYRRLNPNDFREVGNYMRDIKEQCISFKI